MSTIKPPWQRARCDFIGACRVASISCHVLEEQPRPIAICPMVLADLIAPDLPPMALANRLYRFDHERGRAVTPDDAVLILSRASGVDKEFTASDVAWIKERAFRIMEHSAMLEKYVTDAVS